MFTDWETKKVNINIAVLVCGGRTFMNHTRLNAVLDELHKFFTIGCIIHGKAKGADSLAHEWALNNNVEIRDFKAKWEEYGKAAGVIRNKLMLDEGKPDLVVAFPGGAGTRNMINLTRKYGIKLLELK